MKIAFIRIQCDDKCYFCKTTLIACLLACLVGKRERVRDSTVVRVGRIFVSSSLYFGESFLVAQELQHV